MLVLLIMPASLQAINIQINRQLMLYFNPAIGKLMLTYVPDLPSFDEGIQMRQEFRELAQDIYLGNSEGLALTGQKDDNELQLLFPYPVDQFSGNSAIIGAQLSLMDASGSPVSFNLQETVTTLLHQPISDNRLVTWPIHEQFPDVSIGNVLSSPEVVSTLHSMLSGQYAAYNSTFPVPNRLSVNACPAMAPLSTGGWLNYMSHSWFDDININIMSADTRFLDEDVVASLSHTCLYVTLTPILLSENQLSKILTRALKSVIKGEPKEEEKTTDSVMQTAATAAQGVANWLGNKSHREVKTVMAYTLSGVVTLLNFLSGKSTLKSIFHLSGNNR